jgi:hypothetical protein
MMNSDHAQGNQQNDEGEAERGEPPFAFPVNVPVNQEKEQERDHGSAQTECIESRISCVFLSVHMHGSGTWHEHDGRKQRRKNNGAVIPFRVASRPHVQVQGQGQGKEPGAGKNHNAIHIDPQYLQAVLSLGTLIIHQASPLSSNQTDATRSKRGTMRLMPSS